MMIANLHRYGALAVQPPMKKTLQPRFGSKDAGKLLFEHTLDTIKEIEEQHGSENPELLPHLAPVYYTLDRSSGENPNYQEMAKLIGARIKIALIGAVKQKDRDSGHPIVKTLLGTLRGDLSTPFNTLLKRAVHSAMDDRPDQKEAFLTSFKVWEKSGNTKHEVIRLRDNQ